MPAYRIDQIRGALYDHLVQSWDQITVLPRALRSRLSKELDFPSVVIQSTQMATDQTTKFSFALHDNAVIEGVLIPTESRLTACISSQVGCSLDCAFCATGRLGRIRNLSDFEIVRQVLVMNQWARKIWQRNVTNVVLMGMGEPLLNYSNVARAVQALHHRKAYQLGWRRITLSTSGITKGILRMANDRLPCRLAVSLHSAITSKREAIMSISKVNSIEQLHGAIRYYVRTVGRKVTIEYVLLDGINDSLEDAQALVRFVSTVAVKVNLIEYNSVSGLHFRPSPLERVKAFADFIRRKGVRVTFRYSRGRDIMAACGQLANQMISYGTT